MLKGLKKKVINDLVSNDDKVIGKMFLNTILLGIALTIIVIYLVVSNSSDVYDATSKLENIMKYIGAFICLLLTIWMAIHFFKEHKNREW